MQDNHGAIEWLGKWLSGYPIPLNAAQTVLLASAIPAPPTGRCVVASGCLYLRSKEPLTKPLAQTTGPSGTDMRFITFSAVSFASNFRAFSSSALSVPCSQKEIKKVAFASNPSQPSFPTKRIYVLDDAQTAPPLETGERTEVFRSASKLSAHANVEHPTGDSCTLATEFY